MCALADARRALGNEYEAAAGDADADRHTALVVRCALGVQTGDAVVDTGAPSSSIATKRDVRGLSADAVVVACAPR